MEVYHNGQSLDRALKHVEELARVHEAAPILLRLVEVNYALDICWKRKPVVQ